MKLAGKVALVTGASEGIGRALVEQLAAKGVKVLAVSRSIESAEPFDENVKVKNCDVGDKEQVIQLVDFIRQEYGELDIVINNAGIWHKMSQLEEITDEIVDELIATNLLGTIYTTKNCLPLLRKSANTALVNIVSRSGIVAQAGQSVYTASKFGAKGFTDVLREDLKETNIHIMGVYQAGTNTKMFEKTGEEFSTENFTEPEDLAEKIVAAIGAPDKLWITELHVNYH